MIVLENIYRRLQAATADASAFDLIADATAEAVRPVAFSVLVIIVALIPLFTMQGVPGKIFAPMSETYGFALTGAFLFAIFFAPVLASWIRPDKVRGRNTRLVRWLHRRYSSSLRWTMAHKKTVLAIAAGALAGTLVTGGLFLGGEFMPKLEEGNLWVRATLPQDASYETGAKMAHEIREIFLAFPEVTQVVSQMGRPDDGTDVTTFNNIEFHGLSEKPRASGRSGMTKDKLIDADGRAARKISRHRFQLLAEYSGQRRGGHVRREGRKLDQAIWRRHRRAGGQGRRDSATSWPKFRELRIWACFRKPGSRNCWFRSTAARARDMD